MTPLPARLPELTSIRAFAAIVVVLYHLMFSELNPATPLNNLIADGHLGVDLFFMLSGFILAHVYLPDWRQGRFSYSRFLVNRVARIYPLHLAMILLFLLAYQAIALIGDGGTPEGMNANHLPWHLVLMHAWGVVDGHSWNYPSWSVSAEAFAYLMLPVVFAVALRFRPWIGLLGSLVLFALASLAATAFLDREITKLMYQFGILRVITEFVIGVSVYLVMEKYRLPDALIRPSVVISLGAVLGLSMLRADERLIVLALCCLLAALAHLATQDRGNILRHPVLVYLGEVSYATYMVHILVKIAALTLAPKLGITTPLAVNVAILIVVYPASIALYHLIERPGRDLVRAAHARVAARVDRRRGAQPRPATPHAPAEPASGEPRPIGSFQSTAKRPL